MQKRRPTAAKAFAAALFPDSPYGRPVEGSEASVKALQQKGLRDFFARNYRPNRSIIAVVGDVSEQEITKALNGAFRAWAKGEPSGQALVPAKVGESKVLRINKDLTQANIVLGHNGVARGNPDYYALQVMNYVLGGGGFSSRAMPPAVDTRTGQGCAARRLHLLPLPRRSSLSRGFGCSGAGSGEVACKASSYRRRAS